MAEEAGQEGVPSDSEADSDAGHEAATDSFVASLLQRTTLDGSPGMCSNERHQQIFLPLFRTNPVGGSSTRLDCSLCGSHQQITQPLSWCTLLTVTVWWGPLDVDSLIRWVAGESEDGGHELSEEEAAALRAQMEELLQRADQEPSAAGGGGGADAQYGRDMWARCEALTAGATPLNAARGGVHDLPLPQSHLLRSPSTFDWEGCCDGVLHLWIMDVFIF